METAEQQSIVMSVTVVEFMRLPARISPELHVHQSLRNVIRMYDVTCGRGSELLWRRCNRYCTFGILVAHNGHDHGE